jgi:hypothetical protein
VPAGSLAGGGAVGVAAGGGAIGAVGIGPRVRGASASQFLAVYPPPITPAHLVAAEKVSVFNNPAAPTDRPYETAEPKLRRCVVTPTRFELVPLP